MPTRRRRTRITNVWPGFVDALTSLIITIVFVLLIFTVAQFTLSELLTGRDAALAQLNRQISELGETLSLERKANADLRLSIAQLSAELQSSVLKRDTLAARLSEITAERDKLTGQLAAAGKQTETAAGETAAIKSQLAEALKALEGEKTMVENQQASLEERNRALAQLEQDVAVLKSLRQDLETKLEEDKQALTTEQQASTDARHQLELLNQQFLALRDQLTKLQSSLEASEKANQDKDVQIAELGKRLNVALAGKVEELARYRSEFFGKLREILGERPDIRIVGDRFVFQSEVLFPTGSAELQAAGTDKLRELADTLKQIIPQIPSDIFWILEVEGHTDKRPISQRFPSNWELSTARAVAVVKFLSANGIAPEHLAAAGFGSYQPVDNEDNEDAFAKNRRIEFKLTQR